MGPISSFCTWLSSFLNTSYWRNYSFPTVYSWYCMIGIVSGLSILFHWSITPIPYCLYISSLHKIYKELIQLNSKKKKKKRFWSKNRQMNCVDIDISWRRIQMATGAWKRWSTSLIITEMQIKATMKYHC